MKTKGHVALQNEWATSERWHGIKRGYTAADVIKLRGSVEIKYTLAERGAKRLWDLLHNELYVPALGAMTGCQAVQQVQAGLKAIYLSGWQVAADANLAGHMYPDQSLYPANSVPDVVRKINQALQRADQIDHAERRNGIDWYVPIVADAEAGFGGNLNAFELMKAMIEAGAATVHFEDQLASAKKCGHMGGKVLVPTQEFIHKLIAARLAADVLGVNTIVIARTDADGAGLLTSDIDERDHPFSYRKPDCRRFLHRQTGVGPGDCARTGLRALRRHRLVRNVGTKHGGRESIRSRDPRAVSGQAAGVQLFAFVQLEEETRRHCDCEVSVHHPRRISRAEPRDV